MFRKLSENRKLKSVVLYTFFFCVLGVVVFNYFYFSGKTFISKGDGMEQYYKALIYYGRYLRDIFFTLIHEHRLVIPEWSFSMGEGSDILSAMYYTIGDPIATLVAFVPDNKVYLFYNVSILLRVYLSGLFFVLMCIKLKRDNIYAILSGSFIYAFCFWNLLAVSKDIYFLNPMICMPLIVMGLENIFNERKPGLFITAVFLSAVSNFYFFYMIAILTVIYVLVRLVFIRKDIKERFYDLMMIAVAALAGTLIASFTVMPVAYALLTNNRIGIDYASHTFYPFFYYERLLSVFLTIEDPYWLCMGFAGPCLLSLILSFVQIKKDRVLFVLNLICFILICLPLCGKVLNGLSYVSNRWSFAIALIVAYSFVKKWDEFEGNQIVLVLGVFALFAWSVVFAWSREVKVLIPEIFCLFYLIVTMMKIDVKILKIDLKQFILMGIVFVSVLYVSDYTFSYRGRERTRLTASVSDVLNVFEHSEAITAREKLDNSHFYRYSGSGLDVNSSLINDTYSTDFYFSIANPNVQSYRTKLDMNEYSIFNYREYDQRAALMSLSSVEYYFTNKEYSGLVPYGFKDMGVKDDYEVYQNEYFLPFGFTYSKAMSYKDWNELDPVSKQEAMLENIIIEEGNSKASLNVNKVNYTFNPDGSLEIKGKDVVVSDPKKASLKLSFEGNENSEYYLSFGNCVYEDGVDYYHDKRSDTSVKVNVGDLNKQIEIHGNDYQFYNGRDSFVLYLGYYEKPVKELTLTFADAGTYSFETVELINVSRDDYGNKIEALKKDVMKDLVISKNSFKGNIDLNESKYLFMSVPYSKGWTMKVDGVKTEILKANEAYMAVKLDKGHHEIEMTYHTPLLNIGFATSFVSLGLTVAGLCVWSKRNKRGIN